MIAGTGAEHDSFAPVLAFWVPQKTSTAPVLFCVKDDEEAQGRFYVHDEMEGEEQRVFLEKNQSFSGRIRMNGVSSSP